MIDTEAFSNLKKALENLAKTLDVIYGALPKYLRNEMLHPKKKSRGSIRRARKERKKRKSRSGSLVRSDGLASSEVVRL